MRRLTDILEEMQVVTPTQVRIAVQRHRQLGKPIGACLVETRACDERTIVRALSTQLGVQSVSVARMSIEPSILKLVHREIAIWYNIIPLAVWQRRVGGPALHVAMSRPTDRTAIEHLEKLTGHPIEPMLAGDREIATAISRNYGSPDIVQNDLATAGMNDWIDFGDDD